MAEDDGVPFTLAARLTVLSDPEPSSLLTRLDKHPCGGIDCWWSRGYDCGLRTAPSGHLPNSAPVRKGILGLRPGHFHTYKRSMRERDVISVRVSLCVWYVRVCMYACIYTYVYRSIYPRSNYCFCGCAYTVRLLYNPELYAYALKSRQMRSYNICGRPQTGCSGGFRGAYKGILSAAIGSAPGAAMFFSTYETMKKVGPSRDSSQKLVKTCSPGAAGVQELFREPGPMCPRRSEV